MNSVAHQRAGREALQLAQRHYENFPVASLLLPRRFRAPVALLYNFARRADDIADEGDLNASQRLEQLAQLRRQLDLARAGEPCTDSALTALARVMEEFQLPWQSLYDLLSAFTQDVTVSRYASFDQLADYCDRSANPVGRLLLHLYGAVDQQNIAYSDAVCTALQLLNFVQDLESDFRIRGRIYIPVDEMTRFGVNESNFQRRRNDRPMRELIDLQLRRALALLDQGAPLGRALPGRLGLELRAIVAGGRRIGVKLQHRANVYARPRLHTGDWLTVAWSAFRS